MCCVGSDETDVGTLNDCDRSVSWTSRFKSALWMTAEWTLVDVEHADPDSINVMRLRHFRFNLC